MGHWREDNCMLLSLKRQYARCIIEKGSRLAKHYPTGGSCLAPRVFSSTATSLRILCLLKCNFSKMNQRQIYLPLIRSIHPGVRVVGCVVLGTQQYGKGAYYQSLSTLIILTIAWIVAQNTLLGYFQSICHGNSVKWCTSNPLQHSIFKGISENHCNL